MRALVFAAVLGSLAVEAGAAVPDFGGVWLVEKPQVEAKTLAGKTPPLKPEAAALYAKRKQAKAGGKTADDPVEQCLPQGVPRLLSAPQPIQILQKPKQITVLYQVNHQARLFYIDDPMPSADNAPDITYNGSSYAHWDGNALVVDTIAFNGLTWLDDAGLPHGEGLRVAERYELADADHLRVKITVTDPDTFTAPWDMQVTYKRQPKLRLQENPCSEKLWHPTPTGSSG